MPSLAQCSVTILQFCQMGNNNSSRYGVVTQLQFDDSDIPKMIGSLNRTYLLEKSRVVSRSSRERNFHVFYQMVGSDDEEFKSSLQLSGKCAVDAQFVRQNVISTTERTSALYHRKVRLHADVLFHVVSFVLSYRHHSTTEVLVTTTHSHRFPLPSPVAYTTSVFLPCASCSWLRPGKTSNDFKYLTTHAPAEDQDFTGLAEVQDAIRELGITTDEEKDVFKALGGLLHLGQVMRFPGTVIACTPFVS